MLLVPLVETLHAPAMLGYAGAEWSTWQNATSLPWHPKVHYRPEQAPDGTWIVRADSRAAASMLTRRVVIDPVKTPQISWSWKVEGPIARADEAQRRSDDVPARLYFFWNLRRKEDMPRATGIAYIWGNSRPAGTVHAAPDTGRIGIYVLRSGREEAGTWKHESRDLRADYRDFFRREPTGPVTAVALLTDTDQTKGHATAWYGPISVGRVR
ncbi:MAG: DUF3047 domain-containing protein [Candidatus Sericytochromatia bacterium]|nr:DUF3047 domain-containing protein [Candidatus Sericytochromatia bacterium]